jgi:CheY-like chemotaxis protein
MREQILLSAEDNDSDFLLIQMTVEQSAMEIRLCRVTDGEKAISFLDQSGEFKDAPRPDLIILDGKMPLKDGFRVLEHIQAAHRLRSIPVVMLTSSSSAWEIQRARLLGAADFIVKSCDLHTFIVNLKSALFKYLSVAETPA